VAVTEEEGQSKEKKREREEKKGCGDSLQLLSWIVDKA
jgi:hypothetical protein